MQLVADWRECFELTRDLVAGPNPVFLSRIGGSDTNALVSYLRAQANGASAINASVSRHKSIVERFNGYYDLDDQPATYHAYLDALLAVYERSEHLFFCNHQLLSLYFRSNIHPSFYHSDFEDRSAFVDLVDRLAAKTLNLRCYPYPFVEKVVSHPLTLFGGLKESLRGKRVLVVSPFSRSIQQNFPNRFRFFKDFAYPDFELQVLNTPITYAGLPEGLYPNRNWLETAASLQKKMADIDFDVALLSCGSYALPLGDYIAGSLKRKAIYVGGVLQLFFGVMGRRYDNPFFTDQMNMAEYISPLEKRDFEGLINFKAGGPAEAFQAYF